MNKPTPSRTKSTRCARALLLPTSFALTLCCLASCASVASRTNLQIYQPPTLHLKAGVPIETADGIYTPQVDEVWHSAARYEAIEKQLLAK